MANKLTNKQRYEAAKKTWNLLKEYNYKEQHPWSKVDLTIDPLYDLSTHTVLDVTEKLKESITKEIKEMFQL